MKKRIYRKRGGQDVSVVALAQQANSGRLVVAIDVAKVDMVAALVDGVPGPPRVLATVAWKNPTENGEFLALLENARAKLTKRGPSRDRQYLWLATCRWLQKDRVARAWYEAKIARDGGRRAKAVVALMRKLAKALFHVARGAPFDSTKLFDVSRLRLPVPAGV